MYGKGWPSPAWQRGGLSGAGCRAAARRAGFALVAALVVALAGVLAPVAPLSADPGPARPPDQLIRDVSAQLVGELRANRDRIRVEPGVAYRLAEEIVLPHVDFERVARLVLGRHWPRASEAQRERFMTVFRRYLTRTYVTAMVEYVDEILSHADNVSYPEVVVAEDQERVEVPTRIRLENGSNVIVKYRMHRDPGGWKVYDLTLEGISLVANYRSSFSAEVARSGLEGLIDTLDEKTRQVPAGE